MYPAYLELHIEPESFPWENPSQISLYQVDQIRTELTRSIFSIVYSLMVCHASTPQNRIIYPRISLFLTDVASLADEL